MPKSKWPRMSAIEAKAKTKTRGTGSRCTDGSKGLPTTDEGPRPRNFTFQIREIPLLACHEVTKNAQGAADLVEAGAALLDQSIEEHRAAGQHWERRLHARFAQPI